jgi:hypothetical protein
MTNLSASPFDLEAPSFQTLEADLVDLAALARAILTRVQHDLAERIESKRHATLTRFETVLADLLTSLTAAR